MENVRLCLRTGQKRSLEVYPSVPRSCETGNPYGKSSQTSKRLGPGQICASVRPRYARPRVKVRTHQRMGADFRHKGGLGEVVSEQERKFAVCFGPGVLVLQRGMKGEDWSTKLRMALGRA